MILGLDMATKTGLCFLENGKVFASGVQDFSKRRGESNGIMFMRFRKWLVELPAISPTAIIVIAYERAHMRGGAATEIALGLQTHAQEVAAVQGVESVGVHTATLKKFACGAGRADKSQMIAEAWKILGRPPIDDNEADAVHVARWAESEFGTGISSGVEDFL